MTYQEILAQARTCSGPYCKACPVCNGLACKNTVPGPGALNEDGTAVVDVTKLETREVTLGRNDDEYIEVTSGLEEGDVVLIYNQASSLMGMMMGG